MFAAFRLGAVWVPTNFRLMPDEVAYLATASGAKAFLCHGDFPDHAAAVKAASPALAFTWRIGEGAFGDDDRSSEAISAHAGAQFDNTAVEYDDPCWFFFTSGTTGRSKAAVLTHGQMAFVVTNHLGRPDARHDRARRLAGRRAAVAWRRRPSAGAGRARRADHPAADRALRHRRGLPADRDITASRNMFTVPTILKMMVEHPAVDRYDHSSLRYVIYAGAPMYREDQKAALNKLGKVLVQYFGLGEVTGNITVLPPRPARSPRTGREARIGTCGYRAHGHAGLDPGRRRARAEAVRDRRDLRDRPGRVRRLLRQPGGQCQGVPRRLVPHRRSRPYR